MHLFRRKLPPLPAAPTQVAPVLAAKPESASNTTSVSETIDLLELDLSAMTRDVERAAASVRGGARASAQALASIRASTEILAAESQDAKRCAHQASQEVTKRAV